jgi:hypothetical protein
VNGKPITMQGVQQPRNTTPQVHCNPQTTAASKASLEVLPALSLPASWAFAHPNAELLAGINVASLRESPTIRALLTRLTSAFKMKPGELDKYLASSGEVNQLWMSTRKGDVLLLMQGTAKAPDSLGKLANGMRWRRISDDAVVFGQEGSVAEAVKRLSQRGDTISVAERRMKELGEGNDIWLQESAASLTQQPAARSAQFGKLAGELKDFSMVIRARNGLDFATILNYDSPAAARRVLELLREQQSKAQAPAQAKVMTEAVGSSVRLTISIGQEELCKAVDKALTGPLGKRLTTLAAGFHHPDQRVVGGADAGQGSGPILVTPSTSNSPMGITIYGGETRKNVPPSTQP